jgi:hypothetical protein
MPEPQRMSYASYRLFQFIQWHSSRFILRYAIPSTTPDIAHEDYYREFTVETSRSLISADDDIYYAHIARSPTPLITISITFIVCYDTPTPPLSSPTPRHDLRRILSYRHYHAFPSLTP